MSGFRLMTVALVLLGYPAWSGADVLALIQSDLEMYTRSVASEEIGGGFTYHGVPVNVAYSRGLVSTANGDGEAIVLIWLRGDAILEINVETGEYRQHANPHTRTPYASLLSSRNRLYTARGRFVEFDPEAGEFTFVSPITEARAYGRRNESIAGAMIEDDEGVIWTVYGFGAGITSYDPTTGEFRDYGEYYPQEETGRRSGSRHIAADDQGWIYCVFSGLEETTVISLNRETGEATELAGEWDVNSTRIWRYDDGRVYNPNTNDGWMELYGGEARLIDDEPGATKVYGTYKARMDGHFVSGTQGLFHAELPNGERVKEVEMDHHRLVLEEPDTGDTRELRFDIEDGAGVRSLLGRPLALEDAGLIVDGTAYPQRFYAYDPVAETVTVGPRYGQWNVTRVTDDGMFYAGIYTDGAILEWDPSQPWVPTQRRNPESNPRYLEASRAHPHLWRPVDLLVYPGDRYIIHAGYGTTAMPGGGLAIWDREREEATILTHEDLILNQNSVCLAPLPENRLLVGTTIHQRGGKVRAEEAKLYILDMDTHEIAWKSPLLEGAERYNEMHVGPGGEVFIVADTSRLLVFDPAQREIVTEVEIPEAFGDFANYRVGVVTPLPDGRYFMLFENVIAEFDPEAYQLREAARLPEAVGTPRRSGAYLDGRMYFTADATQLYSWQVPAPE